MKIMKKLVSLTIAILMLISSIYADFEFPQTPTNCDFEGSLSFDVDVTGADADIDAALKTLSNGVTLTYSGTTIQEDNLKLQLYFESELKAEPFYLPLNFWFNLDLASENEMTYQIIVEAPSSLRAIAAADAPEMDVQYWLLDFGKMYKEMEMTDIFTDALDLAENESLKAWAEAFSAELLALIPVESTGENSFKIVLDDETAKELIITCIDTSLELALGEDILGILAGTDIEMQASDYEVIEEIKAELPKVYDVIRGVEIFPEDGIIYEATANSDGFITDEKMTLNMLIDVDGWICSIDTVYPELGLGEMDDLGILISIVFECENKYSNINAAQPIVLPALTDKNSIDVIDFMLSAMVVHAPKFEYERIRILFVDYDIRALEFPDAKPSMVNDRTMVPASVIFQELGGEMAYEEIDGKQIITGVLGENTVRLVIGNTTAYVNDEEVELDVAAYIDADYTMVPLRFIAENFGFSVDYDNEDTAEFYTCDLLVIVYSE